MLISQPFNKYTNALIKEFNQCDLEMCIGDNGKSLTFIPSQHDFKTIRELFKEISLFPKKNNERISFKDIKPKELLQCIKRFKEWASLNGYVWQDDEVTWERIIELYE